MGGSVRSSNPAPEVLVLHFRFHLLKTRDAKNESVEPRLEHGLGRDVRIVAGVGAAADRVAKTEDLIEVLGKNRNWCTAPFHFTLIAVRLKTQK